MARFRPVPASEKAQLDRNAERIAIEAESAERLGALAREPVDVETARIRRLQAELGIVRFEDLPAAKPLLEVARILEKNRQRILDELALISVSRLLAGEMGFAGVPMPTGPRLKEFEAKRDQLRAKLTIGAPEPVQPEPGALPESIRAALDVFNSGEAPRFAPTRMARQGQLQDMQIVVEDGIRDAQALIAALRADMAYDQSKLLLRRHNELSVALFRAGQAFAEAAEMERSLRTALISAGFTARSDVLPAPNVLGAILVLGNESDWTSQLSGYRRQLQERKLLK